MPCETQPVQVARAHADELVGAQSLGDVRSTERIENEDIQELGRLFGQGITVQQLVREQAVQLVQPLVVARKTYIELSHALSKIDACHGLHPMVLRLPEELAMPRGAVDVRERHMHMSIGLYLNKYLFGR